MLALTREKGWMEGFPGEVWRGQGLSEGHFELDCPTEWTRMARWRGSEGAFHGD